ncbi:choice-of-anchor H family protein [Aliikangiella sp. G2MR2-5]|uniref:choice-of-anchor H family protein n=1 Tax=Aliikangiella sp. G2MR2-5 TaxID=2788943 RepID=UPI0018ABEF33|nr:choice-of-anchor H family protein [Aliikangiella sp. G2MR2-5]
MKKLLLISLFVCFGSLPLWASERVSAKAGGTGVQVKSERAAMTAKSLPSGSVSVVRSTKEKVSDSHRATAKSEKSSEIIYRPEKLNSSQRAGYFSIYDAWVTLDYDGDYDGFHSEFTVTFDADVSTGSAIVNADIYIAMPGGEWEYLYTTNDFSIYEDDTDPYSVSFVVPQRFATNDYDILIDLYESGYSGLVATIDNTDDSDLYRVPLESPRYDGETLITYVSSVLSDDYDHDGFYTELRLEYDIETLDVGRNVYVLIDLIDTHNNERINVSHVDFVLGNQTEILDLSFVSNIYGDWYDVEIRIMDAYSNEEITYAGYEFSALKGLPIESYDYDDDVEVVVVAEGGGSLGMWLGGIAGLLFIRRKKGKA